MYLDVVNDLSTLVATGKRARRKATRGELSAGVCHIGAAEKGDSASADSLFTPLYSELHRLSKRELARRAPATFGVTRRSHEAYLDIAAREGESFPNQPRFMGYAGRVMRELVIDHARTRKAIKHGGE